MDNRRSEKSSEDFPPYSRLFIVCERKLTEENLKDAFSKFGTIEDVRMPRSSTGGLKGIAFMKFFKTSEAATALEEMNKRTLPGCYRPLKVLVASNRSDIQSDDDDYERYKRIFIHVPCKDFTENDIENHFNQFGRIESIRLQRDRDTGESKGFAYVTYSRFSEAAKAYELCDKKYRAIFAQPRKGNQRPVTSYESNLDSLANSSVSLIPMMNTRSGGYKRVHYICSPYLHQRQLASIFDIIPGMAVCKYFVDLARNCGKGTVSYTNPISAAYAVEKLNEFEYPPGVKIFVKPDDSSFDNNEVNRIPNAVSNLKNAIKRTTESGATDLAQLAEAIAEASKLIKMATAGVNEETLPNSNDLNYCSAKLPPPQPLADIDSQVAKRCFLVCKPQPPPLTVLRDIFCRFGNLINVYTLPNKTVGYARYATVEAADEAMKTLHGAEICGVRIKVLEAEDEVPPKRKRYD